MLQSLHSYRRYQQQQTKRESSLDLKAIGMKDVATEILRLK